MSDPGARWVSLAVHAGERDGASRAAHRAPAGVDDEVAGREQGFDLVEADRADHPAADQARRGRRQGTPDPADLGDQGRDAGGEGGGVGAAERGGRVRDPDAAERESSARATSGGGTPAASTSTTASVCSAASSSPTRSWRRAPTRRA